MDWLDYFIWITIFILSTIAVCWFVLHLNKCMQKETGDRFPDDSTELIEQGLFGDDND